MNRRSALELGVTVVVVVMAIAFFRFGVALPDDDPFRTSLLLLPLWIALLRAFERHAPRRAAGTRSAAAVTEGCVLAVLVLLTLGRRSLGLAATDWFLAAGYLLVLAHRVGRLVVLWRPALGRRSSERWPHPVFFLLPLVVYLAILPWQAEHRQVDGDEPFYLLVTHSLVHDRDVDLANNYAEEDWRAFMDRPIEPQPGDPRGGGGEIYSRHNAFLPMVLAPAYAVAGRWGAMVLMAVLTAALAWMVLRLALCQGRPGAALLAYALFAFSPPLVFYSYQIWIEIPAALAVAVALDRIRSLETSTGDATRHRLILLAVLILLPFLKLRLGLVALPLFVLALVRLRPPPRLVVLSSGALALAFSGLFLSNQLRFGNLLKIHQWGELNVYSSSLGAFARGAFGMFYDSAFGLFPNAPIWFLLLPAAWLLLYRRDRRLVELAVVTLPYLVTLAPRFEWYGGWSPPFRYPLVFLPLLAVVMVPLFELRHRAGWKALAAALAAVTLVLTLIGIVVPGWTYNFADGRTHLLDQAGARLQADIARFFPSMVRLRPATWIWPPLSLLLVPLALWPRRRCRAAANWGLAGLLLAAAALPIAARYRTTRTVEVEDAWVSKDRGHAFPEKWVLQRPRYRSGWVVPPRGRIVVRVAPGGARLRIRMAVRALKAGAASRLRLAAGDREIHVVPLRAGPWRQIELGPFDWPGGEPLVISGGGARFPGRIAIDRLELQWE